ncbi:MAG: nucleotide exchange factor GrpE [Opitutales bacterium]
MTEDLQNENNENKNCSCENSQEHKCCGHNHEEGEHNCSCGNCQGDDFADAMDYNPAKELLEKIDELQLEAQKNKELYMREVASFDTYRRRMQREMLSTMKFASIPLVESLLPALDNLDLAMANIKEHLDPTWAQGIEMVAKQINSIFAQNNIIEINPAKGEDFDPKFVEAISHVISEEVEEGKVLQVVRIGYRIDDRLIRPASVVISKGDL